MKLHLSSLNIFFIHLKHSIMKKTALLCFLFFLVLVSTDLYAQKKTKKETTETKKEISQTKKDGTPDMRYKKNKQAAGTTTTTVTSTTVPATATTTTPAAAKVKKQKNATVTPSQTAAPTTVTTTAVIPQNNASKSRQKATTITSTTTRQAPVNQPNTSADPVIGTDAKGRTIYQGKRGGRYYINANGNKEYIKKN